MDWLFILFGLILLFAGGEASLHGAVSLAKRLGVSPAIIGLTIIGFGTSAPELVVTIQATFAGQQGLAIGNVVGSNISNLLLILGVGAMICPLICSPAALKRDGLMMLFAFSILFILARIGVIQSWHGAIMLAILIIFIVWSYYCDRKSSQAVKNNIAINNEAAELHIREAEEISEKPATTVISILYIIAGLFCLVGGAHILVLGAVNIAQSYNIPDTIIGLTIVSIGTSLPELAATVIAAMRRHTDVAIGNIIGSCLFNIFSILGITAMISPIEIAADIRDFDIWVMIAAALVLIPLLNKNRKLCHFDGAILITLYMAYMTSFAWRMGYI